MKVLFLTRFDFTNGRKDGGLEIAYRNYFLIKSYFGIQNVQLCIVTPYHHALCNNVKYFNVKDDIFHNYLSYFLLKDRMTYAVENKIADYINNSLPDVIFWDGSTFGQIIDKLKIKPKSIIFFHNIERQYTWDQVKKHSWLCIFRYVATVHNEKKMIAYTNNYICMNHRDEKLLLDLYRVNAKFIFPATFTDTFNETKIAENSMGEKFKLLFIGSYFAHNYQGLIWFINEVLAEVDCVLEIVGKNMEKLRTKIYNPKVNIIGTVENIDKYYREADAMVMPIFMGGGMKVKTAEALMYGKTIFASTEALQGYDIDSVDNIFRCDSKKQFIQSINGYIHSNKKTKMNLNVRRLFLERYCTDAYYFKFKEYIESVVISDKN